MDCVICDKPIKGEEALSLECAHLFHIKCIITLIRKRWRRCPLCRHKICWNVNQIIRHKKLDKR